MNAAGAAPMPEPSPQEAAVLLRRVLAAVEKEPRHHWAEIACAVVLSLATMATAWCAYQSNLWSGVQAFRLAAANQAGRAGAAAAFAAQQGRAFDASMFISYIQAKHDGNKRQEEFLFNRFRPEMKKAVEAWLKTDPFNNPAAPSAPFKMAEYVQPEMAEANRQDGLAAQALAAAEAANQHGDNYVLLTVLFASVLFFGGIAGTLDSRRLRVAILLIAFALFLATLSFLGALPICRE